MWKPSAEAELNYRRELLQAGGETTVRHVFLFFTSFRRHNRERHGQRRAILKQNRYRPLAYNSFDHVAMDIR